MKFRTTLLIGILLLLLAAAFTRPEKATFEEFISKNNTMTTAPVIQESNSRLFSIFTVTYYDVAVDKTVKVGNSTAGLAVERKKESWLGLFGRFWKL